MYSQNFVESFQKFSKIFQIFSFPQIVENFKNFDYTKKRNIHPIKGYVVTDDKWHFSNLACKGTLEFKLCPNFINASAQQLFKNLHGLSAPFNIMFRMALMCTCEIVKNNETLKSKDRSKI